MWAEEKNSLINVDVMSSQEKVGVSGENLLR